MPEPAVQVNHQVGLSSPQDFQNWCRRVLKIAAGWPWTDEITTAWQRIHAIPHPI
jgi:hypothetical protein